MKNKKSENNKIVNNHTNKASKNITKDKIKHIEENNSTAKKSKKKLIPVMTKNEKFVN